MADSPRYLVATKKTTGFLNHKPLLFLIHLSVLLRKLSVEFKFSAKVRW